VAIELRVKRVKYLRGVYVRVGFACLCREGGWLSSPS
jgi:hypothetical protein